MALFGKKKQKETPCCTQVPAVEISQADMIQNQMDSIKILGSGCKKCNELERNTKAALLHLGLDLTVTHVTDFAAIAAYGVMTTPALVLDQKVLSAGKVLKKEEIASLIQKNLQP